MNRLKRFSRQSKIIIGTATILGSAAGLSCAYVYSVIESLTCSK